MEYVLLYVASTVDARFTRCGLARYFKLKHWGERDHKLARFLCIFLIFMFSFLFLYMLAIYFVFSSDAEVCKQ